jgi:glutathione S-transferase
LERVNIHKTPHETASGADFTKINPKGYVPALRLDDGSLLSRSAQFGPTALWEKSRVVRMAEDRHLPTNCLRPRPDAVWPHR